MKNLLLAICSLLSLQVFAQHTIVDPSEFPVMTLPTLNNWAVYTREDKINKKILPAALRSLMLPNVRQPKLIGYTPSATGNPNDRGSFVQTSAGRVYYIDGLGNSIQTNDGIGNLTIADNDIHAGVMCVPVGAWYRLSNANTLGLAPGTLRQRLFGTLTPCTNVANPISPGQTKVVGGAGFLKVNGDPDTNPYAQRQDQWYESSVAFDTVTRQIYTYNSSGPVGNRWNLFIGASVDTRLDTAFVESDSLNLVIRDISGDSILETIKVYIPASSTGKATADVDYNQIAVYSEQTPEYKWERRSTSVRSDHWADGVVGVSFRDTLLAMGGWYTTGVGISYDTILYSVDDGATWGTYPGNLPANLHTFAFCEMDGYWYIAGGDYLSSSTEKKSVWRTNNFRTWQTMTSNAEFGERILGSILSHGSTLYLFGGQSALGSGQGKNEVWKSVNNGASWTKIQDAVTKNGFSFLGQNISNQVVALGDRFYVVGGQYYGPPFSYTNRVFSIPIDKISDKNFWKQETSIPTATKSYVSVAVWDGKIWAVGGYDSIANTRDVYTFSRSGKWRQQKNYFGDSPGTSMSTTHAAALVPHRDRLFRFLGNFSNDAYMLSRSNDVDTIIVNTFLHSRILTKTGSYTYNSETSGGLASVFGNNIVSGATANTIKRPLSDNGNYMNMRYDRGIWWGTGMTSTVGTDVTDITAVRMRMLTNGDVKMSDNFSYNTFNGERLQVDGSIAGVNMNASGDVTAVGTVSGRIGSFTGTAGSSLPAPLVVTAATAAGGGTIGRVTNTTLTGYTIFTLNETNNNSTPVYLARYNSSHASFPNLFEVVSTAGNFSFRPNGGTGFGVISPTAIIHTKAGTASANTSPFKFSLSGHTQLTTQEPGEFEPSTDGSVLLYTNASGVRKTLAFTSDIGNFWSLSGNSVTAGTQFLGSTNNVSLRFRTNNIERVAIDSATGNVRIGVSAPSAYKLDVNGVVKLSGPVSAGANIEGVGTSAKLYLNDSDGAEIAFGNSTGFSAQGTYNQVAGNTIFTNATYRAGAQVPAARLQVLSTTTPQLRVAYDASNYINTAVASNGDVTMTPANSDDVVNLNARQLNVGSAPVNVGGSGAGYPGVGYNVAFTGTANTYNYKGSDYAFLIGFGTSAGNRLGFNVAPSGTGGGAITFTELMSLHQPTSRVGILNTAPAQALDVNGRVRISDVSGITPTTAVGRNAAGDIGTLGMPSAGLTITGGSYVLANDLAALEAINTVGFPARIGTDAWLPRSIASGAGISVANGNGASGNPTITNIGDTDASDDITTATAAGGDLTGTYPDPTIASLQGKSLSASSPETNQILKWTGSQWEPRFGGGSYFVATSDATAANTTTATTLVGSGVGTTTIPSGFLQSGRTIRIKGGGIYSAPAIPGTITISLKVGAATVATTTTTALANATNAQFSFEMTLTSRGVGISATGVCNGYFSYASAAGTTFDSWNNGGSTFTHDTTTSNAINLTAQWDTADAGKTITAKIFTIEIIN